MPTEPCPLCGCNAVLVPSINYDREVVRCDSCGHYEIGPHNFSEAQKARLHILSYLTRSRSDGGSGHLVIEHENIDTLLDSVVEFSPLEKMDRLLIHINNQHGRPDRGVVIDVASDFPLVMARDADELRAYMQLLVDRGFIRAPSGTSGRGVILMTPYGWEHVEQVSRTLRDSNQAFVAMWFDPSLDDSWERGIRPALISTGFDPYRVDQDPHNEKIDDRIIAEIRRSGILAADFTGHRQGVYFEAGFAMGLNIPVIWMCRASDIDKAHFDTRQYNHVVWDSPEDLKTKLAYKIAAVVPGRHFDS